MEPEIHVISTGTQSAGQFTEVVSTIHEYVDFIHIREKSWTANDHAEAIRRLVEKGVPLEKIIVNDRVDVAVTLKVRGVQLAYHSLEVASVRESFPFLQIGRSVHSFEEALTAVADGADFIIYGHIYETASKPDLEPRGVSQLAELAKSVSVPVIAIGGIKPENAGAVISAGAAGIAVMSGILEAEDPLEAVKAYKEKMCVKEEENEDTL